MDLGGVTTTARREAYCSYKARNPGGPGRGHSRKPGELNRVGMCAINGSPALAFVVARAKAKAFTRAIIVRRLSISNFVTWWPKAFPALKLAKACSIKAGLAKGPVPIRTPATIRLRRIKL
jgi:hypothetical protein